MRKVVFLFMFFAATLQGVAKLRYHSELLQRMAKATALSLPDSLGVMTDNDSTWQYKGRQLRVRTNASIIKSLRFMKTKPYSTSSNVTFWNLTFIWTERLRNNAWTLTV